MSRTARYAPGGLVYHVLNRGVGRRTLFEKDGDYSAFEKVLEETLRTRSMRICAYCLMPNHWHLVLWPEHDGDLAAFMQQMTKYPREAVEGASPRDWVRASLPGALQVVPCGDGRVFLPSRALCGAERLACQSRSVCRVVAMVEPSSWAARRPGISDAFRVAASPASRLVADRQSAADRGRVGGVTAMRPAQFPLRQPRVGSPDGEGPGTRIDAPRTRKAEKAEVANLQAHESTYIAHMC